MSGFGQSQGENKSKDKSFHYFCLYLLQVVFSVSFQKITPFLYEKYYGARELKRATEGRGEACPENFPRGESMTPMEFLYLFENMPLI